MSDLEYPESWLEAARAILAGDGQKLSPELENALAATADAIRLVLRFDADRGPRSAPADPETP